MPGRRSVLSCMLAAVLCAAPANADVATTRGRTIVVDGRPFFPRLAWGQCPDAYDAALALGVNVFMGGCEETPVTEWLGRLDGRAYLVPPIALRGTLEADGLLGWHQPDEPENWGFPPGALARPEPASGRLTFLTLTSRFLLKAEGPSAYAAYAARADVLGFDLYPVAVHCNGWIRLADVYEGQRELAALAPGKPTYQWIETGPLFGGCGLRGPVTPAELRAEVWLAIAGGATGIGYFTHTWTTGSWLRFDVAEPLRAEIWRANAEIDALEPALLAPQLRAEAGPPVYAGARDDRGRIYAIAVNASAVAVTRTLLVPALARGRTAEVWGTGRRVPVVRGTIRDRFEPLAVRVSVAKR